jgi:hypothetical protein
MIASGMHDQPDTLGRANKTLAVVACLLVMVGFLQGGSLEQVLAYLLVVAAAIVPSVLWIRMGAAGIPIFPIVALGYIPYFALPLLSGGENTQAYTLLEIASSGFTVALFLATATVAWRLIAMGIRVRTSLAPEHADPVRVVRFVLAGLVVGVLFHIGQILNMFGEWGAWYGLLRSIAITFVMVACFLTGVIRAQGIFRGPAWIAAVCCLAAITLMSWSSLFLVGGMLYMLAAALGYVLVAKRVPLAAFGVLFVVVAILHAGKGEMRERYWEQDNNSSESLSASQLPGMMVDWFEEGIYQIATGNVATTIVERASLIQILLLAQSETPDRVDYLRGETYALLPEVLVPRFLDPNKPASQVGMDLLNIRYGILTAEGAASTAVGWGLVAEGYANFGYFGVIGVALLLGAVCGALSRWSANSEIVSIPTLASIATMLVLVNLEADVIQLVVGSLQSFAAVVIFSMFYRWFSVPRKAAADSPAEARFIPMTSEDIRRRP